MIESLAISQKSLQLNPLDAEAHNNLGVILEKLEKLNEAELSYKKAIALKPNYSDAHNNLGNVLKELGRLDESESSYRKAIVLKPDFAEAHNNLGITLKELCILNEAETCFRQAIVLKSDFAEAHNNLGVTLQELGRFDEAKISSTKAVSFKPDYASAYYILASLKRFESLDEQYLKMQELYFDKNLSEEQLCYISFALAKASEDLEDFEQAFKYYKKGNELHKKVLNYDITENTEIFRQIKSNYKKIEQNSLKSENLRNKIIPNFIVGMPRSGTTLVEQIISSHTKVTGMGELNFVGEFGEAIARGLSEPTTDALLDFREKYLFKIQNFSNNNKIVIDKMPNNFLYIGLLAAAFPEAKIIHVKRSVAAVCWSNYKHRFVSKKLAYAYSLDDIKSYYSLYEDLMKFWLNSLNKRIYNLDYELLTVNPENETRQLIDYLDLDWDKNCLSPQDNKRFVRTASNIQIRKKVYQGSSQQWKKYKPFLNGSLDFLTT